MKVSIRLYRSFDDYCWDRIPREVSKILWECPEVDPSIQYQYNRPLMLCSTLQDALQIFKAKNCISITLRSTDQKPRTSSFRLDLQSPSSWNISTVDAMRCCQYVSRCYENSTTMETITSSCKIKIML